jgi:hypothetical protein
MVFLRVGKVGKEITAEAYLVGRVSLSVSMPCHLGGVGIRSPWDRCILHPVH